MLLKFWFVYTHMLEWFKNLSDKYEIVLCMYDIDEDLINSQGFIYLYIYILTLLKKMIFAFNT